MTEGVPTSAEILQSLNLLRSTDPNDRARGIDVLSRVPDDPRVLQVFEHFYQDDPDPRVRYAAWLALSQHGPSVPAPKPAPDPAALPPAAPTVAARMPEPPPAAPAAFVTPTLGLGQPAPAPPLPPAAQSPTPPFVLDDVAAPVGPPPPPVIAPIAPPASITPPPDRAASQPSAAARPPLAVSAQGLFLFDAKNRKLIARERVARKRRRSDGCGYFLLALVMLGVLVLLVAMLVPRLQDAYRLRQDGITVTGELLRVDAREDETVAIYRFALPKLEGSPSLVIAAQPVTQDAALVLVPGSPVEVTYWPENPAGLSRIPAENPKTIERDRMVAVTVGVAVLLLVLILLGLGRRRSARRPSRVLPGQVVLCTGRLDADGDYKIKLQYRFKTPRGRVISAQRTAIRNDLRRSALPQPGATVAVYYRSDRRYWLL